MPKSRLAGIDEFFDSAGVQLAPLGFGFQSDWEIIERVSGSAVASLDVFWDADIYDEIEVSIKVEVETDADELELRLSEDGSTFLSGSTDYEFVFNLDQNQGGGAFELEGNGDSSIRIALTVGDDANGGFIARAWINHLESAFKTKLDVAGTYLDGDATQGTVRIRCGGVRAGAGTCQGIQLLASDGGSFPGGDITGTMTVRGRRITPVSFISQDDWVVIEDRIFSGSTTEDFFWDDQVYDEIEITASSFTVGTDARSILFQVSDDGSTIETGAEYTWLRVSTNTGSGPARVSGVDDTSFQLMLSLGTGTDEIGSAKMHILDVSNTTNKKGFNWDVTGRASDGLVRQDKASGQWTLNDSAIRGFRLSAESAATFSGRVRVRGRRITPIGVLKQDWEVLQHTLLSGNQATIEFIDIPSGEFDEFELRMTDVGSDTSSQTIGLQFSSDNGATWKTGGSDYQYAHTNLAAENTTASVISDDTADHILVSANFDNTSVRKLHGTVWMGTLIGGSRKNVRGHISSINDFDNGRVQVGAGWWVGTDSDATTTAFRLILVAGGNFTSGSTFTLRGRRKAA